MSQPIELDGNIGGGSVLRVGIPLAIALKRPIKVINVRHKRKRKGLQVQHLVGINLISNLTASKVQGANVGSDEIIVYPGPSLPPPNYYPKIQVPTAAAVSLIVQTLSNFVFAARHPLGFEFAGGGTHVSFSPNFDVLKAVNKPLFEKFGVKLFIQLVKPGFYPHGGGIGKIYMNPTNFTNVTLEYGEVEAIDLISHASKALETSQVAEKHIEGFKSVYPEIRNQTSGYAEAISHGSALSAIIYLKGGSIKSVARIGDSKLNPFELGRRTAEATEKVIADGASVDEQLADQLILPLAFAPSGSTYTFAEMVQHIKTNLIVIEQILGKVLEVEKEGSVYRVTRI